jgi:hypothetical protein
MGVTRDRRIERNCTVIGKAAEDSLWICVLGLVRNTKKEREKKKSVGIKRLKSSIRNEPVANARGIHLKSTLHINYCTIIADTCRTQNTATRQTEWISELAVGDTVHAHSTRNSNKKGTHTGSNSVSKFGFVWKGRIQNLAGPLLK